MTFAKQLKAAREASGLSIADAAKKAGYTYSSIYKFETGRRTPPQRAIAPILTAIGKP